MIDEDGSMVMSFLFITKVRRQRGMHGPKPECVGSD